MKQASPIEWSIDTARGHIQGPLDLAFLDEQEMAISLEPDQLALLVRQGQLQTVYLDGFHTLDIGPADDQIDPSCSLIFLALAAPLKFRWTRAQPLRWGCADHQQIIGGCELRIDRPGRFFATFLYGHDCPDSGFITRLIDQMIRGLFENLLRDQGDSQAQALLTSLTPADLNEELDVCGLHCTRLAVYTLAPPIEAELPAETHC